MTPQSFTIRKTIYEIKKGDYIMYNGASYQFFSGDSRILRLERFSSYNNIVLTKKAFLQLDLSGCKVVEKESNYTTNKLIFWIF